MRARNTRGRGLRGRHAHFCRLRTVACRANARARPRSSPARLPMTTRRCTPWGQCRGGSTRVRQRPQRGARRHRRSTARTQGGNSGGLQRRPCCLSMPPAHLAVLGDAGGAAAACQQQRCGARSSQDAGAAQGKGFPPSVAPKRREDASFWCGVATPCDIYMM
eukprot:scaffold7246_cov410-Prasinococcus_capsulatus_cf.AAC.11